MLTTDTWGGASHEQVKAFERRCRHLYGASPAAKRKRATEEAAAEAAGLADPCGGFVFAGKGGGEGWLEYALPSLFFGGVWSFRAQKASHAPTLLERRRGTSQPTGSVKNESCLNLFSFFFFSFVFVCFVRFVLF